MIPVESEQSLVAHPAQLPGHGASVHRQIIRQLLPVKRDTEFRASAFFRFHRQIRQQLVPGIFLRHVLYFVREHQIFLRQYGEQIMDEPGMKFTGG